MAPIYVINLLVSDLVQLCCMIIWLTKAKAERLSDITCFLYVFSLMTSVCFMVCVALERYVSGRPPSRRPCPAVSYHVSVCGRYLVISQPLWYRFRRTIHFSVVVCLAAWALSLVTILSISLASDFMYPAIVLCIVLLLPFPVLVFSLVGSLKALSSSISVPSKEKRRIVGVLVLVLLNYTLLFLPTIVLSFCRRYDSVLHGVSFTLIQFSPLANLVLYVFLRKGTMDHLPCLSAWRMTTTRLSVDSRLALGRSTKESNT